MKKSFAVVVVFVGLVSAGAAVIPNQETEIPVTCDAVDAAFVYLLDLTSEENVTFPKDPVQCNDDDEEEASEAKTQVSQDTDPDS